jgi:hypothetical protein
MPETYTIVQIRGSGFPISLEKSPTESPIWPIASNLLSSLVRPVQNNAPIIRETVFLTRAQQRIMDNALRRSLRIIA